MPLWAMSLQARPLLLMGSSVTDTLHEHCQQVILGYRRRQQVPEWRRILPPNYSQWGLLHQVLVVTAGTDPPPPGGGVGLGGMGG